MKIDIFFTKKNHFHTKQKNILFIKTKMRMIPHVTTFYVKQPDIEKKKQFSLKIHMKIYEKL